MSEAISCIFCDIRDGSLPAALVAQDDDWLAFLDRHPLFEGHVLLVPRLHVRNMMDLPDSMAEPLMLATKRLSIAVREACGSHGIFVASNNGVSQSVDHLHIHIVPRNRKDGLRGFMWPRQRYESEEHMQETAKKIGEVLR